MSTIYNKIQQAAHQHDQLLRGHEELDGFYERLEQQTRYIMDLEGQMNLNAQLLGKLKTEIWNRRDQHEEYQRFASSRDEATAEAVREWREYEYMVGLESSTADKLAHIKQRIEEARDQKEEILAGVEHRKRLSAQLDALYNSIFNGPTPEFPEEDAKEKARDETFALVPAYSQYIKHKSSIISLLNQTSKKLSAVHVELDRAHDANVTDVYVGRSVTNQSKLAHLNLATSLMRQVRELQDRLKQSATSLPELSQVYIPDTSLTWIDLLDKLLADTRMLKDVKVSITQVERAQKQCDDLLRQQRSFRTTIIHQACFAWSQYQKANNELRKVRQQIFQGVVGFKTVLDELQSVIPTEPATVPATPDVDVASPPGYTPSESPPEYRYCDGQSRILPFRI